MSEVVTDGGEVVEEDGVEAEVEGVTLTIDRAAVQGILDGEVVVVGYVTLVPVWSSTINSFFH